MLKLSAHSRDGEDYLHRAAEPIRAMSGVMRVRVLPELQQLEIVFRHPAPGLLHSIHLTLQSGRAKVVAGNSCRPT
jgi:hypothetical protein